MVAVEGLGNLANLKFLIKNWFWTLQLFLSHFSLRYFEYVQKHHPEKAEEAREALQNHFKGINKLVNESMILLYKLPEVARQFQFDLPDWIPKPPALVSK